jgi:hypothetical protein
MTIDDGLGPESEDEYCPACDDFVPVIARQDCGHVACPHCQIHDHNGKSFCGTDCMFEEHAGGLDTLDDDEEREDL